MARSLLLLMLLLVAAVVVASWAAVVRVEGFLERTLADALAEATGVPASVHDLEISLLPPAVRIRRVVAGDAAKPALEVVDSTVRLRLRETFLAGRPVVDARIDLCSLDARRLPARRRREGDSAGGVPLAWLPTGRLEIGASTVLARLGDRDLEIRMTNAAVAGSVSRLIPAAALSQTPLRYDVEIEAAVLRRGGESLRLAPLVAGLGVGLAQVSLRSFRLGGDTVALAGAPRDDDEVVLEGTIELQPVAALLGVDREIRGRLRIDGTWRGGFAAPVVEGQVSVRDAAFADLEARTVAAHLRWDEGALHVSELDLDSAAFTARGSAALTLTKPYAVSAEMSAPQIRLGEVAAAWLDDRRVGGSARGNLRWRGTLSPLTGDGQAQLDIAGLQTTPLSGEGIAAAIEARARVEGGRISLEGTASAGATGRISFQTSLTEGRELEGRVIAESADAGELKPLIPALQAGAVAVHATLGGTLDAPALRARLDANGMRISGVRIESIAGEVEATPEIVAARELRIEAAGGHVRVDGVFPLVSGGGGRWEMALEDVDLKAARAIADGLGFSVPRLAGTVNGSASGAGGLSSGSLAARLLAEPFEIEKEDFASALVEGTLEDGLWKGRIEVRSPTDAWLRLEGSGRRAETLSVRLESSPWEIAEFRRPRRLFGEVEGILTLAGEVQGTFAKPRADLDVRLSALAIRGEAVGSWTLQARAVDPGWLLELEREGGRFQAEVRLREEPGLPFSLHAGFDRLDLAPFIAATGDIAAIVDGSLRLEGDLHDLSRTAAGELSLQALEIRPEAHAWAATSPVQVRGKGGLFRIEPFELRNERTRVRAGGQFTLGGEVTLDVDADADAALLELFGDVVLAAEGRIVVDARVNRDAGGGWHLEGDGSLDDLGIDFGLPFVLARSTGDLRLRDSRVFLENVHGRMGGGTYQVNGFIDIDRGLALDFRVTEASTGLLEWLEDRVSGAGSIGGAWSDLEIRASVEVLSALYDRNLALIEMGPWMRRRVARGVRKPDEKPLRLDIDIHAADGIFIDTNVANAEFSADVHVGGTTAAPRLQGDIEALEGQVIFGKRVFDLVEGLITFRGSTEINPLLNFQAVTDVQTTDAEYTITAQVTGPLHDYSVMLSSEDTALTQTDIASLLAFGRTTSELQSESGGVAVGDVIALAPMLYGGSTQSNLAQYFPVDRLEIGPGYSGATGSFSPSITVGKDLTEDVSAVVSSVFGVETRNTVRLEYRLTQRVVLGGSWESRTETSEGAFGGDVRFRYQYRRFPYLTLWSDESDEKTRAER